MPGMSGNDVIKLIRNDPDLSLIKIIVISGLDEAKLAQTAQLGADAVFRKPVAFAELLDKINALSPANQHQQNRHFSQP